MEWGNILPILTGAGGFAVGVVSLIPLILRLTKAIKEAQQVTLKIVNKYKNDPKIAMDIARLRSHWDIVLECLADFFKKFKLKKIEKTLRDLL